jgi:hypothetical protein
VWAAGRKACHVVSTQRIYLDRVRWANIHAFFPTQEPPYKYLFSQSEAE